MSMRVLVTNDDGIDAPGIRSLTRALVVEGFDVRVIAPNTDYSGASASLGSIASRQPIHFEDRVLGEAPGVPALAVDASPAGCSLLALRGAFADWMPNWTPDLVASGINAGANAGSAIQFSGTIGAAFTGARLGAPALAVSLAEDDQPFSADDSPERYDVAATMAASVLTAVAAEPVDSQAASKLVYNLNIPGGPAAAIGGPVNAAPASIGSMQTGVVLEDGVLRTSYVKTDVPLEPGTDRALLAEGFATLTVLGLPMVGDAASVLDRFGKTS